MRLAALALVAVLAVAAPAAPPPSWTPDAWKDAQTVELTTDVPGEGTHTFPVWLVVLDGQLYVRLGSRAAGRVEKSSTAPLLGVAIAGQTFPAVRGVPAPEDAARVAAAMADKYWSDVFVHWLPHPLTLRLEPQ